MQDLVGQQVGNYRLIRLIGYGGYAQVYLAEHLQLPNLHHAIKILTASNLEASQREEFLAEARTIASLQRLSDHIVQIRDFGLQRFASVSQTDMPYFVMEYAAAGTVRDVCPKGERMPLERIVFYVQQVAEALQCAHEQDPPIVHRDIKPENMLLRTREHLLLSDFGIAITSSTSVLPDALSVRDIVGTATYIAPEQLRGRVRRASDQYSLGVVVYEWLCGVCPFEGTNTELCYHHLMTPPPPLRDNYPQIKPEVEAVVMRALEKKPEERYPGIQAFARALANAAQQGYSHTLTAFTAPSQRETEITQQQVENQRTLPMPPETVSVTEQSPVASPLRAVAQVAQQRPLLLPLPSMENVVSPQVFGSSSVSWPASASTHSLSNTASFAPHRFQEFFRFSGQYAHDPRYRIFRISGFVLNILAALAIALLAQNFWLFPVGFLLTYLLFTCCIRAVEEVLAACFALLLASYWGWLGWLLGTFLDNAGLLNNHLFPAISGAVLFFGASLILHLRYIARKNS